MKRFWLIFGILFYFLFPRNTYALVNAEIEISPITIVRNQSGSITVTVTNRGDQDIRWMSFERINGDVWNIDSISASGWNVSGNTISGGVITAGDVGSLTVNITATNNMGTADLKVRLSDNDLGDSAVDAGSLPTIQVVDSSVPIPVISGLTLSVGDTSVTVSWNTDISSQGTVQYGLTTALGSEVVQSDFGTSRSLGVSGLTASTTYYYRLISVGGEGGTLLTEVLSFTTGATNTVTTTTTVTNVVTNTNTVTTTNTNTVTKVVTDTTPPALSIDKLEKRVNESAPVITGGATDDRGVASVEYQVVGKDTAWITASLNEKVGTKKVTWEALPSLSLDGTYKIKFRAVDVFGNTGVAKEVEFVIDQLPPTVGGGVLSVGALTISENGFGVIEAIENVEYELVLFENGGADKLILEVGEQKIEIKKIGSGLWRGLLKFKTGEWVIKVSATDGAENTTARDWAKVKVLKSGNITKNGQIIKDGRVRVMWLDPTFKKYSQWEADDYGQVAQKELKNPGALSWILPRGEYYLEALVDGKSVVSQKIILDTTTNISGDWEIQKANENFLEKLLSSIGWKSLVKFTGVKDNLSLSTQAFRKLEVARELWIGKRSVVLVTSPDLPRAGEALRQAKEVANENESQLVVVGLLKSENDLKTWLGSQMGGLYADYKGEWLEKMKVGILPQLYEIDSRGEIVREKVGVIK